MSDKNPHAHIICTFKRDQSPPLHRAASYRTHELSFRNSALNLNYNYLLSFLSAGGDSTASTCSQVRHSKLSLSLCARGLPRLEACHCFFFSDAFSVSRIIEHKTE